MNELEKLALKPGPLPASPGRRVSPHSELLFDSVFKRSPTKQSWAYSFSPRFLFWISGLGIYWPSMLVRDMSQLKSSAWLAGTVKGKWAAKAWAAGFVLG